MRLSRRRTLTLGMAGAAIAMLPLRGRAEAGQIDALIARFTDGAQTSPGALVLEAPRVAENGASVSVTVDCPGAVSIRLLAPANPTPELGTFTFGPLAGSQRVSTRIRLAESQEVIALARMTDGSFAEARAHVSVTISGCT
ncbi:thiosulfate oxidation carrier protein SoxY [Pararhodobacter sp.]|uniref:thiosulfate oxidation carrier protein SoxY n=1 Tax=Pararhodobacter sp. TaxID=2127056 RepID=UPI002FDD62DF